MTTATEAKSDYISKMGEELGAQFAELWQEVAHLHMKWNDYVELFGSKESRIDILNQAAPAFFGTVQNVFWEDTLLHLARLTDETKSLKCRDKKNLTIRNLPELVQDIGLKKQLSAEVDVAIDKTRFCRDWRNRIIAHRDLGLAMDKASRPLEQASRKHVNEALDAIAAVLNLLSAYYMDSETKFRKGQSIFGAALLLYVLSEGLRAQAKREERLRRGEWSEDDIAPQI